MISCQILRLRNPSQTRIVHFYGLRMKKSAAVPAVWVSAVAAALLTGCDDPGPREVRHCVDEIGQVLPDETCNRYAGTAIYRYPRYVYGGIFTPGDNMVRGFRATPDPTRTITTRSGRIVSTPSVRGGFGGGGRGFGFGG